MDPRIANYFGKQFGYPECCRRDFIYRVIEAEQYVYASRIQKKVTNGTGFIPCKRCSWLILSKQCTIDDLIVDRIVKKPFPNAH